LEKRKYFQFLALFLARNQKKMTLSLEKSLKKKFIQNKQGKEGY
jgi:hypothetical protein